VGARASLTRGGGLFLQKAYTGTSKADVRSMMLGT
jgi:hypothetical protein